MNTIEHHSQRETAVHILLEEDAYSVHAKLVPGRINHQKALADFCWCFGPLKQIEGMLHFQNQRGKCGQRLLFFCMLRHIDVCSNSYFMNMHFHSQQLPLTWRLRQLVFTDLGRIHRSGLKHVENRSQSVQIFVLTRGIAVKYQPNFHVVENYFLVFYRANEVLWSNTTLRKAGDPISTPNI